MTGSSSAIAKNTKVLRSSLANRLSDYEPIIAGLCGEGDTKVVAEFAGSSSRYIEKPERVEDANEI